MPASTEAPLYWLDLFTEETWLEAARRRFTVTGFAQRRWSTVQRIRPGDLLVCYLTRRSAYVGMLRVTGPAYQDETPIWTSQVFPSRLPATPELVLRPDAGVSVHELRGQLSYFRNLTNPNAWTGYFRGSPAAIKPEDARVIDETLRAAAADPLRRLDLDNLPMPAQPSRRKRHLAAPKEETRRSISNESSEQTHAPAVRVVESEDEALVKRLIQSATTSEDAASFEVALAEAFAFLGFRTERRSGPGDTDVLVVAPLGEEAYAAVIDGKASRQGRVGNAQVDWFALERHKERHGADHILVVAPGFSGGELTRDAERTGAALLSANDLGEVLRLHAVAAFALPALRDLFRYPGKPDLPLGRMREHARETQRLQRLLPDILDAVIEAYQYELYDPVNADALLLPLASRRRGRAYSREEITAALELLCVPQLGILRRVSDGRYVLQMPKETLTRRLRALVAVLEARTDDRNTENSTHLRADL